MLLGQFPRNLHELHADNPQPARLKAADNFAGQSTLDAIRFDNNECPFHVFYPLLLAR
jgi:hypothetical protein